MSKISFKPTMNKSGIYLNSKSINSEKLYLKFYKHYQQILFGENHFPTIFHILLKFCKAIFKRQQTLQTNWIWVLKKKPNGNICGNRWAFFSNLPGQTCSICCRSISRAGLIICKWRRNFLTTVSKAFSRITCSKSRPCRKIFSSYF